MPAASPAHPCGLVLAAGAGRRFGGPKALARTPGGTPWLVLAVRALQAGGCGEIVVALGAAADDAALLVPSGASIVRVDGWESGVAASVRAGLHAAGAGSAPAAVILPVDTPDVAPAAVARLVRRAAPDALAQAVYAGEPGHPVLIGRAHWSAVAAAVRGDIGARPYLVAQGADAVECGDLWSGADRDER
ncbi:nucleotidyltransferase family protein [Microbacterium trichothecenolyticum]|uniref:CTP:molybdopterin cytidylyltransferase MocA n=1 Tax=Microbacterium trichothecenolyticum TaxID=69370 RepID=A0ABU0TVK3_MICTR|nr:NTP transferase domain-containing protein [Microbacterium trichothecenolyticum]MDQ1123681.1 CTP:molybdopterin cytidylyltransferase MocA [Microbacterium trichothecenolyticum]